MSTRVLTFLILCFASTAFAEDFKTVNGKEYKDATVTRVEPDGIIVKTNSGVTKVYFTELPKEVQEHFHYDSGKAASYSAEQAANYTAYQKQQDEARRQQQDADARTNAALAAQQTAINRTQDLQTRYAHFRNRKTTYFSRSAKQKSRGHRTGRARLCATSQIRKNLSCRFSKVI